LLRALEYPIDLFSIFVQAPTPKPILHFQWAPIPFLDAWVWRYLKRSGYSLIYTAHNIIPHNAHRPPAGLAELYSIPDTIIVHTPELAQEFQSRFPHISTNIHIIPHGVLFEDIPEISRMEARDRLAISLETPVALFWGLITPYKGVESLIHAFSRARDKVKNAQLIIAGKPSVPVEPYQALIQQLNLSDAVKTRFEFIPTEEIATYFGAADVVVLPYLEASQSGVLLAAYRFGKAVIVTETGGLAKTVSEGQNGLVIPPGDENELAKALINILSDLQIGEKMGGVSRQLGLTHYNWQNIAHQTMAVYQEVLQKKQTL